MHLPIVCAPIDKIHSFIYILNFMPPKKKANKAADEAQPTETQPKPADKPEPVPEIKKEEPKPVTQAPPPVVQTPLTRLEQVLPQEPQQPKPEEPRPQKVSFDDVSKLSEEEKIKLRRLRFGVLGTETTIEEAQRIKQERLKKFGGPVQEDKDTIEKRKQKFGNVATSAEDPEIVKRRLQKFGNVGVSGGSTEDKAIIEERRKKFGDPQANVSLDDEIKKSKPIHKFHPKFNNNQKHHGGKSHHQQNPHHNRR